MEKEGGGAAVFSSLGDRGVVLSLQRRGPTVEGPFSVGKKKAFLAREVRFLYGIQRDVFIQQLELQPDLQQMHRRSTEW